ncbi:uncharacterized protein F4812DRAFT_426965 [Daldinia caldariorum]|uniref:uncharacterized protein n=1 Tax=Daldinia caldariorum TaxID=326644 RepID=UPI00200831CA|nr:uncharacterized protein F4812DRAFT_426965 [Daldinia caldariorum]KAI1468474.1 hypothetical protein F4812DRAFT_426965 [Daldinia caldariorum]
MLAARDQENLAFSHQNGAALKQQQGQVKRQLQPKTPGGRYANTPIKVPLNDENGAGGAKSILGGKSRGNENALTSKGGKSVNKSNLATPAGPRSRAVLGDKTTNAKAKGSQTINAKGATRELEKSQGKAPGTSRPKQKQPQAELQKLVVHAEETDPLSEEEIEYCPPKPKDLPYESDVFPDGALKFDALKPENLFKGFYDYYYNPVDENGVSLADKELEERNRKAMEECDRRIQEDIDSIEWGIQEEPETTKKATSIPTRAPLGVKRTAMNRVASTIRAKKAAEALSMDDTTKSMQRKAARSAEVSRIPAKKTTSLPIPTFKRQPGTQPQGLTKKSSTEMEANSRTTIGYNKGRSTASILAQGTTKLERPPSKTGFTRSNTTLSTESDRTITPALYTHTQAAVATEDLEWKERVPFLSIFNPEDDDDDDDDCDLLGGNTLKGPGMDEDEDFEFKLAD